MRIGVMRSKLRASAAGLALLATALVQPARAVTIELMDVAPDRVERQRAFAEGRLPLPGTPNLGDLQSRLADAGLKSGDQMFIRIFKEDSELEIWLRKGSRFVHFATYPMCHWSGTLGPKIREGDKQNPEGFYTITSRQLHRIGRWPRSLNLGFPNTFDKAFGRTGSYILVHGGCSSTGCFAMTNAVIEEIYNLTEAALRNGQDRVHVHVFPFRLTEANLARHKLSDWYDFWANLKEGYDAFEAMRVPPKVAVCDRKYLVHAPGPEEVGDPGPLASCGETRAAIPRMDRSNLVAHRARLSSQRLLALQSSPPRSPVPLPASLASGPSAPMSQQARSESQSLSAAALRPATACQTTLPSCQRWSSLAAARAARLAAAAARQRPARIATAGGTIRRP